MNLHDVTTDLFAYLMAFRLRLDAGVKTTPEEVQKDLLQIFREQEVKVRQNPVLNSAYDRVRYPLVVFADEIILNSKWEYARDWGTQLLERRFFETEVGGDRFFQLCEELDMSNPDVASIFYTCLSIGFRGRYDPEAEELRLLKRDILTKCPRPVKEPGAPLCPAAYSVRERKIRRLPSILKWSHIFILFVILLGIHTILDRIVIWNYIKEPVKNIRHLAATRLATGETPSPLPSRPASPKQVKPLDIPKTQLTHSRLEPPPSLESGKGASEPDSGHKVRRTIEPYPAKPEVTKETIKEAVPGEIEKKREGLGYTIQVAIYYTREKAEEFAQVLKGKGYDPYVVESVAPTGRTWYLVRMGHYKVGEIKTARQAAAEFTEKEHIDVYVTNRAQ
jgi:type IV/VI secretion system ImpK/VasF family protein